MAHKFKPGDYVRERSSPYAPARVYEVHSVTPTGLPRVIRSSDGVQKILRGGDLATVAEWRMQLAADRMDLVRRRLSGRVTRPETTDEDRDAGAREWLVYRGWTVTPPVAKEAT